MSFLEVIALIAVLAVIGAAMIFFTSHNKLTTLFRRCQQAYADVDVQLRYRHDLIPGLIEIARSYAGHERGVIDSLMRARTEALQALGGEQRIAAETVVGANIVKLMSVVETLPEMRTSAHYSELRSELTDVNHKIAASRRFWNMAVQEYNATLDRFPNRLFAAHFGLSEQRSYDLGVERVFVEEAPVVKL
jgi:LemA protein